MDSKWCTLHWSNVWGQLRNFIIEECHEQVKFHKWIYLHPCPTCEHNEEFHNAKEYAQPEFNQPCLNLTNNKSLWRSWSILVNGMSLNSLKKFTIFYSRKFFDECSKFSEIDNSSCKSTKDGWWREKIIHIIHLRSHGYGQGGNHERFHLQSREIRKGLWDHWQKKVAMSSSLGCNNICMQLGIS